MSIINVCNREVVTVTEDAVIQETVKCMRDNNVGAVVVTRAKGGQEPCGIVTDRDIATKSLLAATDLGSTKVTEVMNNDLLLLTENDSVKEAIDAMSSKGVRRAPVVDSEGKLIGIVTADDLLMLLVTELNSLVEVIKRQSQC